MGALEVGDYTEALTVVVRDLGCSEVLSITSPVNKGSIAFHRKMGFEILPGDAEIDGVAVTTNYDGRGSRLVSALFGKTACVRRIFPNSIAESK